MLGGNGREEVSIRMRFGRVHDTARGIRNLSKACLKFVDGKEDDREACQNVNDDISVSS